MNGQKRARLTAAAVGFILLLTGIAGCESRPGAEQAIEIAPTSYRLTLKGNQREALDKAFHNDAQEASLHTEEIVTAELTRRLKRQPALLATEAIAKYRSRS